MAPKVWPLFLKSRSDELLSSWLTRIAHNHQQKLYTFYRMDLGNAARIWNIDIDRTFRPELIETVALRTNSSVSEVLSCTFNSYSGRLFQSHANGGQIRWILPLGIYHTKRKRSGLLYCPGCLENDGNQPYFRKKWRLAFSVVCPDCRIYLKDKCEVCGQVICFTRIELGRKNQIATNSITYCFNCQNDIRKSDFLKCDNQEVEKQMMLYEYLDN